MHRLSAPRAWAPADPAQVRRRVLIYRSELLAGSETFIAAQASALRTFEPVLVGIKRIHGGLELPLTVRLLTEGNSLADKGRRILYRRMGTAPSFMQQLEALQPALIHAHFAVDACESLPLARALGIPLVVTLHGYDVMMDDSAHRATARGRAYLRTRDALWSRAELFLCVSQAVRTAAIARGFPAEKLVVHVIGIDVSHFRPERRGRASTTVPPAAATVLFVGRLVEKKGCSHLLRAMTAVQAHAPRVRLIVIGDGPLRSQLETEAASLGVEALFLGAQRQEQVRTWMAAARLLAAPSVRARTGDAEGLPIVLCEAMAMGLPVVSFRSSGIDELVSDGETGLLAEEGDEAALAVHIIRLCKDDALCARLSKAARAAVEVRFDLAVQTAELERLYDRVLGGSPLRAEDSGCGACGTATHETVGISRGTA